MTAAPLLDFAEVLERRGLYPAATRLLRHDLNGAAAWRRGGDAFGNFISFQKAKPNPYQGAEFACHFLPGPTLPDGAGSALFVALTKVGPPRVWDGTAPPRLAVPEEMERPDPTVAAQDLHWMDELDDLSERMLIRWGHGTRSWSQWAGTQRKAVLELRQEAVEPPFPGFADFHEPVTEAPLWPASWARALGAARGVYLLTCRETGEQYVGSAYGDDGFMGRWLGYAATGHGGNVLLMRRGRYDFLVSILELASFGEPPEAIVAREARWKEKLGSRAHGLNLN